MDAEKSKILQKELLTTKDASQLIGVSLPSIINWADAGRFDSFRTPGGHRRIRKQDFLAFACSNGYLQDINLTEDTGVEKTVILVDTNLEYMETLKVFLEIGETLKVMMCTNVFEAGVLVGKNQPSVLVFDQDTVPMPIKSVPFLQHLNIRNIHIVSLATEYPVPPRKQSDNYIYLNKGKSIREVAISIKNLVASSVVVL